MTMYEIHCIKNQHETTPFPLTPKLQEVKKKTFPRQVVSMLSLNEVLKKFRGFLDKGDIFHEMRLIISVYMQCLRYHVHVATPSPTGQRTERTH